MKHRSTTHSSNFTYKYKRKKELSMFQSYQEKQGFDQHCLAAVFRNRYKRKRILQQFPRAYKREKKEICFFVLCKRYYEPIIYHLRSTSSAKNRSVLLPRGKMKCFLILCLHALHHIQYIMHMNARNFLEALEALHYPFTLFLLGAY